MFAFRDSVGPVDLAFTDRVGGVSRAPYDELNLALVTDDDPDAVAENWSRVLAEFAPDGATVADMRQVHGNDVVVVGPESAVGPLVGELPTCDGIVTDEAGPVLVVRAADCVPVLLADPGAGVVGAAHAGRNGLVAGVVPATVARMRDLGAHDITAWVGPAVCGACYEVPADLRDEVAAAVPEARSTTTWGTPALDIPAGVRAQLTGEGVTVVDASRCTLEWSDLYSYRRDGVAAGRQAGLVRLRP